MTFCVSSPSSHGQGQTLVNEGMFGFMLWLEKTSKITQSNPNAC